MKTKKQLIKEKEKIEKQILELESAEKQNDFKEIKFKNKTFRIYKWDKPVGDFLKNLPKGFRLAEHYEFIELFDDKLIDCPEDWEVYFTKHYSKRKQKENLLSSCCLYWFSYLGSYDSDLSLSSYDGRVVIVK